MKRVTVRHGRKRTVDVPLFSGYVFCDERGFVGNERVPATCRNKVAQVLRPTDPDRLRTELMDVAEVLCDRQLVQERVVGRQGGTVRITGGSLVGCEGKILRLKPNRWQVVVEVSFIGARIVAEVDESLIERAGPPV